MEGPGKNSLGTAMLTSLRDKLREAAGAPVLLTGAGDAFSAGLNLKEIASIIGSPDDMLAFLRLLEEAIAALYLYPGPTVAAVNGHAIAGGTVLTLCCDHRVVTSNPRAKLGLNETPLGLRFPPRILTILRRRVPRQHQHRVLLGGDLVDPQAALALGLVDEVADDPVAVGRARLALLADHPPSAYALTKADLNGAVPSDLVPDDVHDRVLREAATTWVGPTVVERVVRVLSK